MGSLERAICALEKIIVDMNKLGRQGDFSAARLNSLGQQLLTYIRSNRTALVDYGARYRAGRRISTSLAKSAVNSLVAKRMVKSQQMRWSPSGAHLMLQVRAAMVNGNLRQRLREQPDLPVPAPPPDLSANPAFAQSRIKPQTFCRSPPFRAGPRVYSASRGCFEQASSVGMASKGSVRERAYRGAKPDLAGCNGQLDLEARFKDLPGQFKPVDLCRQVYFGQKHPHVQADI